MNREEGEGVQMTQMRAAFICVSNHFAGSSRIDQSVGSMASAQIR